MKYKVLIFSILISISGILKAQEALNGYLQTAARNNPGIKAKFNEYMAALKKVPQVGTLPDPQLVFGYFIMPVETRNGPQQFKISLTQVFPWFGTLGSRKNVAAQAAKVKYEAFEEARSKLFFDVKAAYYSLYFIDKNIGITQDNIKLLSTLKSIALIKVEAGKASGADELRIEMELADLQNRLEFLQDKLHAGSVKFNNLLDTVPDMAVKLPDTLWSNEPGMTSEAIFDSIKVANHNIKSLERLKQTFAEAESLARKQGSPNIIAGIDYTSIAYTGLTPESGRDALMVKVGISLPVYRKKYSALIDEAAIMQQAVENKKVDKVNALQTLFEKVWAEYRDAQRREKLYKSQAVLAKKALSILETEYSTQSSNFEEVLRMERKWLSYSLEYQKALADKQAAVAFMNYLMGL